METKRGHWNKWDHLAEIREAQREREKERHLKFTRLRCPKCRETFTTLTVGGAKTCPICCERNNMTRVVKKGAKPKNPEKEGLPMKEAIWEVWVQFYDEAGHIVTLESVKTCLKNVNRSLRWLGDMTGYNPPITRIIKRLCKDHIASHGKPREGTV